ncbi:MAG: FecR family protein [Saprospiraceae bacterium]|nr:FecR family protein [Saprospiraceae bacterium]
MKHINNTGDQDWKKEQEDFFRQVKTPFEDDSTAIWEKLSTQIDEQDAAKHQPTAQETKVVSIFRLRNIAAAACVLLLAGIGFMKFYTVDIITTNGQQLAHTLPDGSVVQLNAQSNLNYAPYWWTFDRSIKFEGEAFFKVEKGQKFRVISSLGSTQVLGTQFNILARGETYKVYCTEGKVEVRASGGKQILKPNQLAVLENKGLKRENDVPENKAIAWTQQKFNFMGSNITFKDIIEELERQYDVELQYDPALVNTSRGGAFDKPATIEECLDKLDIQFTKIQEGKYKLSVE